MSTVKGSSVTSRLSSGARFSVRGLAVCLSFVLAACSAPVVKEQKPEKPQKSAEQKQQEQLPEVQAAPVPLPLPLPNIKIAAVGDIMLGSDYPHNRLPAGDASLLQPVASVLSQADLTFGNLEGVLQDGGEPVKRCSNPNSCYLFRTPTRYAQHLQQAGFDVLSLANNHARDFGEKGRDSSMASLEKYGMAHSGRDGDVASITVNGVRVGIIAFAPYHGSNNMLALESVKKRVQELDAEHDIVLVSFHGGAEGSGKTRIPFEREYYHNEDRGDVVKFAHMVIEAGADLVIGHGPHVPRAVELYRDRLIAYSLGNFATYWGIKISGTNGLAPILTAELDASGKFVEGKIVSARQIRPDGTVQDDRHAAARMISELTKADFPDTPLIIDDRGNIRRSIPSVASGAPPKVEPQP